MKSSEIKTEEDINRRISEIELKKIMTASRKNRRLFINDLITLAVLFIIVLLGTIYPSVHETIASSLSDVLQNIVSWYVLLVLLFLAIAHRIIRYRLG